MLTIKEYLSSDGSPLRYGLLTDPHRGIPAKQALLFVPGLGGSVKEALSFLEPLLEAFDPIYAPDLRGFGLNEKEPLPHPKGYLADLIAFQKTLNLARHESLVLAGISLGGGIATQLAVEQPDHFSHLILIAPAYKASSVSFPISYIVKQLLGCLLGGAGHRATLPYSTESLTRNPTVLNDPQYKDKPPLTVPSRFLLQVSWANLMALQKTRQIAIPTLMLVPGKDIVCDPVFMRKGFDRIPERIGDKVMIKTLKDYPELYHDVLMEPEAPQLAEEVLQWIRSF